ncbi:MAG: threonine synthase [Lentisphaeria bacterium]|jgi:threonine synthase|nr:threonine synthase [Lentisphaeria bacterium]
MPSTALYLSTRGQTDAVSFQDAVLMGLATDGGLLLPREIPDFSGQLDQLAALPYPELATRIMLPFVAGSLSEAELRELVRRSYATFRHPEVTPLVPAGPVHILELFHGPTLAFKDVALQFLGNLFEHILAKTGGRLNILGATSGDTGSAAIAGVRGRRGIHIFIMHPKGKVSPLQERQMTSVLDDNVHNIAIEGTFDDGQRVLKEVFNDLPFKRDYHLGAVNSVNWARVLAQIVYYFHAALRLRAATGKPRIQASVPTGNFGDIFAGYLAVRMGAPIARLILATNENDILARFFNTGVYARGPVFATSSPSMDIQVASNFERYLYYRVGENGARIRELMDGFARDGRLALEPGDPLIVADAGSQPDTLATIAAYHRDHGYLLDPHTAVGVAVAERFLDPELPTVCLATAHPAKFPATIREAVGADLARHPILDALAELPTRCATLPASKPAIEQFMRDRLDA